MKFKPSLEGTVVRHVHLSAHEDVGTWTVSLTMGAVNDEGDLQEPRVLRFVGSLPDFQSELDQAYVILLTGQRLLAEAQLDSGSSGLAELLGFRQV